NKPCPPRRLGVALKPHCRQRQLLHPPRPNAAIHPARHYTITAAGFCRGSLVSRLPFVREILRSRGLKPERCGRPLLFDRVKKLAVKRYSGTAALSSPRK